MFRSSFAAVLVVLAASAHAEEPASLTTRAAIQHHLFSQSLHQTEVFGAPLMAQGASHSRRSPGLAVLYSLLLPGLGEFYVDGYASGKVFSIAEAVLWLGYATVDVYGTTQRDDARSFAAVHAGVNPVGKDDQFYVDIGNFMNTDEFNEKRLREREPGRLYEVNAGFGWQWDTESSRQKFKDTRLSADNALNNRKFVVAAIVVNHIASAINAARAAISHNKDIEGGAGGLQIKAEVLGGLVNAHGIQLKIEHPF